MQFADVIIHLSECVRRMCTEERIWRDKRNVSSHRAGLFIYKNKILTKVHRIIPHDTQVPMAYMVVPESHRIMGAKKLPSYDEIKNKFKVYSYLSNCSSCSNECQNMKIGITTMKILVSI